MEITKSLLWGDAQQNPKILYKRKTDHVMLEASFNHFAVVFANLGGRYCTVDVSVSDWENTYFLPKAVGKSLKKFQ